MNFELLPILDKIIELYQKPRTFERFREYLALLSGDTKNDLEVPIGAFNPMAKEHILYKLDEFKKLGAEEIAREELKKLNEETKNLDPKTTLKVVLCVSDDLKGAWTNRFTSDYDSKFKLNGLISRNFCTPIFWTGEKYSKQLIADRIREYCYRSVYRLSHPAPQTLEEHILQEQFVYKKSVSKPGVIIDFNTLDSFYRAQKTNDDYLTIFNFLYGDSAMESLGNTAKGISEEMAGYKYAQWLALH
ncbi:MAG TPA: hypothetical protein VGF30_01555 [Bacteroidia bacterium]